MLVLLRVTREVVTGFNANNQLMVYLNDQDDMSGVYQYSISRHGGYALNASVRLAVQVRELVVAPIHSTAAAPVYAEEVIEETGMRCELLDEKRPHVCLNNSLRVLNELGSATVLTVGEYDIEKVVTIMLQVVPEKKGAQTVNKTVQFTVRARETATHVDSETGISVNAVVLSGHQLLRSGVPILAYEGAYFYYPAFGKTRLSTICNQFPIDLENWDFMTRVDFRNRVANKYVAVPLGSECFSEGPANHSLSLLQGQELFPGQRDRDVSI